MIYEQGYWSRFLVVYVVDSKKDKIDEKLKSFKLGDGNNSRYISFYNISLDDRLRTLHLNKLNNIDARFKTLNRVNTNDLVIIDKEQAKLWDILM